MVVSIASAHADAAAAAAATARWGDVTAPLETLGACAELTSALLQGGLSPPAGAQAALARAALTGVCVSLAAGGAPDAALAALCEGAAAVADRLLRRVPGFDAWLGGGAGEESARGAGADDDDDDDEGEGEGVEGGDDAGADDGGALAGAPSSSSAPAAATALSLPAGSLLRPGLTMSDARALHAGLARACAALQPAMAAGGWTAAATRSYQGVARPSAVSAASATLLPSLLHATARLGVLHAELADALGGAGDGGDDCPGEGGSGSSGGGGGWGTIAGVLRAACSASLALTASLPAAGDGVRALLDVATRCLRYYCVVAGARRARQQPALPACAATALSHAQMCLPLTGAVAKAWLAAALAVSGDASPRPARRQQPAASAPHAAAQAADDAGAATASPPPPAFAFVTGGVKSRAAKAVHAEVHDALVSAATAVMHAVASWHAASGASPAQLVAAISACVVVAATAPTPPPADADDASHPAAAAQAADEQRQLLSAAAIPLSALQPPAAAAAAPVLPLRLQAVLGSSPAALSHATAALARCLLPRSEEAASGDGDDTYAVAVAVSGLVAGHVCTRLAAGLRDARRYSRTLQTQLLTATARVCRSLVRLLSARPRLHAVCVGRGGPGGGGGGPALSSLQLPVLVSATLQLSCGVGGGGGSGGTAAAAAGAQQSVALVAVDTLAALLQLLQLLLLPPQQAAPSSEPQAPPAAPAPGAAAATSDSPLAPLVDAILVALVDLVADGYAFLRLGGGSHGGGSSTGGGALGSRTDATHVSAMCVDGGRAAAAAQRAQRVAGGGDDDDEDDGDDASAGLALAAAAVLQAALQPPPPPLRSHPAAAAAVVAAGGAAPSSPAVRAHLMGLAVLLTRCAGAPRVFDDDAALDAAGAALLGVIR